MVKPADTSGAGWIEAQRKPSTRLLGFHIVPSQPTALPLEFLAPLVREISWRYSQILQTVPAKFTVPLICQTLSSKSESKIRKLSAGGLKRGRVEGGE